ncbi:MAG: LUD domain-containing protein [Verrucomicrobia bacterium]|nr:LUD domain-containing protein [Verrucomicrobiota bacterium]MCH8510460.1 LUD domain-containing protein [Kiritimatiellia bacterium]
MSGREEILGRVREALSVPSHAGVKAVSGEGVRDVRKARGFLPDGGATPEARLKKFRKLAAKLKAEVEVLPDLAAAGAFLADLAKTEGWRQIASHRNDLTNSVLTSLKVPILWTDDEPGTADLEQVEAGVTSCEALIAQTGSVFVTGKGCGGRALSVLPPHHVVIATLDQLLPDMLAAFDLLRERYGDNPPSFVSFITGASRTGDIERILVLGAHGPKRLTILIVGN